MKIAIMGSGGVGGLFGTHLVRGGADVTFIARGTHLDAMRRDGIRIEGAPGGDMHVQQVQATDDPASIGPVDLVLFAVKLGATQAAIDAIRPLVGPDTAVVSFQNGVLKDDYLKEAFGEDRVFGGVGYVGSAIDRPGVIRQTGPMQRLVFGEFDGRRSARVEAFLAACEAAGSFTAEIADDIRRATWEKFVFLTGLSGTTATMRVPIGPIRSNPQTRAFLHDVMHEVVTVGRAHRVDLPENYAEIRLELADDVAPAMTSSLHHDLQRGNPLEVPWLAGGVVELGRQAGVPTPLNRAIADILALYVDGTPTEAAGP
jgi:2-dehydropantoate 2-reductase